MAEDGAARANQPPCGSTDEIELLDTRGRHSTALITGDSLEEDKRSPSGRAATARGLCWCSIFFMVLAAAVTVAWIVHPAADPDEDDWRLECLATADDGADRRALQRRGRRIFPSPITFADIPWSHVNRVIDGDTICVTNPSAWNGESTLLRLVCVDAPEMRPTWREPWAYEARDALADKLQRAGRFTVIQYGIDGTSRGRPLVALLTPEPRNVNLWLVEQGDVEFACHRNNCSDTCDVAAFAAAEQSAQNASRGKWGVDVA